MNEGGVLLVQRGDRPAIYRPREACADIGLAGTIGWKVMGDPGLDQARHAPASVEHWGEKEVRADISRRWITGQAKDWRTAQPGVPGRLAGPHGDFLENHLRAELAEGCAHQVVVANRGAADRHDDIA